MKEFRDFEGRKLRLSEERERHILEHPEMKAMMPAIKETLQAPEKLVQSLSDPEARLYYRLYRETPVGEKYLCVTVKVRAENSFVLTAYLTDRVKKGGVLWPRK